MTDNEIAKLMEPVLRFCLKRISDRADAEDLAGEIILATLEGSRKYEIASPEAWVWRIAHNRYARYVRRRKEALAHTVDYEQWEDSPPADGGDFVSELIRRDEYEWIFRALHTLSCDYRRLTIDYYDHDFAPAKSSLFVSMFCGGFASAKSRSVTSKPQNS